MTYDELVTNVRNYTEVDSNVFSDSVINTFITFAENRILREIDLDVFNKEVTANMRSSDVCSSDLPKYYSVFDDNTFYIAPTPNNNFLTQLGYIARPVQLSSTTPTTWMSTNAPEALFYAVLIQAHSYTKGPMDMLQYYEKSYKEAMQGLGIEQQGRRRRDEYDDGQLRIKLKAESPGP